VILCGRTWSPRIWEGTALAVPLGPKKIRALAPEGDNSIAQLEQETTCQQRLEVADPSFVITKAVP
jgi:hypothetical protein